MDDARRIVGDGAVLVEGRTVTAVDTFAALRAAHPGATVIGNPMSVVTPGYINGHQHLTGDRLINSCIPDAIASQDAIFGWAVPVHAAHTGDDDELSATIAAVSALTNGITCTIEAGTVAHPERVAAGLTAAGMRARIGRWGWDVEDAPFAADVATVIDQQRALLGVLPPGGLVEAGVTLVGHDLMSDELVVAASELARAHGVGMTFHISPSSGDAVSYLARTGRRPLVHLSDLGALGPHVLLAHAVHLDDQEVDVVIDTGTAVAACPWAYLRLAQGVTGAGRYADLLSRRGRLAVGCDAENAGDAVDVLRAATLLVGLLRDGACDPFTFTAHDALALATIDGARAIGSGHLLGSLEVGKLADIVVHDTSGPQWIPPSTDVVMQLMWGSDGRSVSDVIVDGRHVVRDRVVVGVDLDALRSEATSRRDRLLAVRNADH